jgi:hypothetical protein
MSVSGLNEDFIDILRALGDSGAEFMIVGAHAMAVHGVPRATGDLDILVRPTIQNAQRVLQALRSFGAPVDAHGIREADLATPGVVYQIGLPPRRIDILTEISGISFDEAWATHFEVEISGTRAPFIGRQALLKNKRATGRDKDLVDARTLELAAKK